MEWTCKAHVSRLAAPCSQLAWPFAENQEAQMHSITMPTLWGSRPPPLCHAFRPGPCKPVGSNGGGALSLGSPKVLKIGQTKSFRPNLKRCDYWCSDLGQGEPRLLFGDTRLKGFCCERSGTLFAVQGTKANRVLADEDEQT